MLESYCKEHNYIIYDHYVDDGYSGTSFDRPEFKRMIADIENGLVNMVITKDLSRLGRDYIMVGYYTEIYFVNNKIRYIAVNDNVDTLKNDNDIAPFKNILNDMYAKDISKKVRSAKRQRALKGMFICGQPPYGYKLNPLNRNKLIIDKEPAEAVRLMFRLAVEGKGVHLIAKALSAKQILSPGAYKITQGDTRFEKAFINRPDEYKYIWRFSCVQKILRNRVYVGDMVNRKAETVSYKTKKRVLIPEDKQIVVENMHEPIISREDFERATELRKARHSPNRNNYVNVFRSVLFCAECGHKLTSATRRAYGKRKPLYRCHSHYQHTDKCVKGAAILYEDLLEVVKGRLKEVFKLLSNDEMLEKLKTKAIGRGNQEKTLVEKAKIEKRLSVLSKMMKRLYEDFAADTLSGENYTKFLADYQREQKELNGKLTLINKELEKSSSKDNGFERLKTIADGFINCEELTAEMVNKLIERIEISRLDKEKGIFKQEINIIYRFISTSI